MAATKQNRSWSLREAGWPILIGFIILIGLIIRVLKSWAVQFSPDSDAGFVQIMAKHMAEGHDFPVFFYGQPYMGSLEPAVSAFLCKLFGITPFVVTLGTGLLGVLVLPLVYLWGRNAGGRRAGLIALLYCLVGSESYFRYSVVSRGGYMTMLVCGLISLALAIHITVRSSQGRKDSIFAYLALGLAAGLGWWSNQLVLPFLLAAGCVLLLAPNRYLFRVGIASAGIAFLVGSAPWWGWNITHGWGSISYFGDSAKDWPFTAGLRNAWGALCGIADLPQSTWWGQLRAVLLLFMVIGFLVVLVRDRWRGENKDCFSSRIAAVFVSMFMVILYARSDYGNPPESRYLMPLIPAMAIMLGISTDWLLRHFRFPLGVILFVFLVPNHVYELHRMNANTASDKVIWERVQRDAPQLAKLCDGACFASWEWLWMNFASNEKVSFANLPKTRYAPDAIKLELAKNPAFLAEFRRIDTFLAITGGKGLDTSLAGNDVLYGLTPPPPNWSYVESSQLLEAKDGLSTDCRTILTDGIIDTCWQGRAEVTNAASLDFTFVKPLDLCGLRLFGPDGGGPRRIKIEAQTTAGAEWVTLIPQVTPTSYFWSGPYVQLDGVQAYLEFRFEAPSGGIRKLRVVMPAEEESYPLRLGEILFMERSAASPDGGYPSADECEAEVRRQGLKQFYGPRWVAEHISMRMGNRIETLAPSLLKHTSQDEVPNYDSRDPYPLVLHEKTGFLMDVRDVPRHRTILRDLGLQWEETPMGLYDLLVVAKPAPTHDSARFPTLAWTEIGCFKKNMELYRKQKAQDLYTKAVEGEQLRNPAAGMELLRQTLQLYPNHQPARLALASALETAGRKQEAEVQKAELKKQTVPDIPARVRFANGVELIGLSLPSREIKIGGIFPVVYFWKCPPTITSNDLDVFVHFRKEETEFQDDHSLLEDIPRREVEYQPFDEIFTELRQIAIPSSLAPGENIKAIRIGLCNKDNRLEPGTDLKVEGHAVLLPVSLSVAP